MTKRKKSKRKNEVDPWRESEKPISKKLAWLELIGWARHVNETNWTVKNRKLILSRGSLYCRKSDLATRWGWPELRIRRFFKKLEREEKIIQESLHGVGTVVRILDFDNAISEFYRNSFQK